MFVILDRKKTKRNIESDLFGRTIVKRCIVQESILHEPLLAFYSEQSINSKSNLRRRHGGDSSLHMESSKRTVKCFRSHPVLISLLHFSIVLLHRIQNISIRTILTFTGNIGIFQRQPKPFSNTHLVSKNIKSFVDLRMPEDIIQE